MKAIRSIGAILSVWIFVFALSGKTLHVLSESVHEHGVACTEKEVHFHEAEHSCFICEFDLQCSDAFQFTSPVFNQYGVLAAENDFIFLTYFLAFHADLSSRGPPVA